jgi:methyltransferase (TIGR00027 family)
MKPISSTAFYCCGVRMLDAESPRPVCGDTYARRFMEGRGLEVLEPFRRFTAPNASNVARHRLIDDLLRDDLAANRDRLVVLVGAGFDSRAFRLGAGRWVELDEPAVVALKEERLPAAACPQPLQRIAIDFERDSLAGTLAPFVGAGPVTVVVEGVLMYLADDAKRTLLDTLVAAFPGHLAIADLLTRRFFDRYGGRIHRHIASLGASFQGLGDRPAAPFLALGYRHLGSWSTVEAAKRFGSLRIPWFLLRTVFKTLATDYRVHRFEAPGAAEG